MGTAECDHKPANQSPEATRETFAAIVAVADEKDGKSDWLARDLAPD
jgi:hypothetical protein